MHYFKRNIGDYHKKAGRLTMLEHGSYTLLMDACYDRERFPTKEEAIDWCWARTPEEVAAVEFVLSKFFVLIDGLYTQKHIAEEIAHYHENAEKNRQIALEREAARRAAKAAGSTDRAQTVDEPPPNHKPKTKNHKPKTIGKRFVKPTLAELITAFAGKVRDPTALANKFLNHYESKGWKVGKEPMQSWPHSVAGWITRENDSASNQSGFKPSKSESNAAALYDYLADIDAEEADRAGVAGFIESPISVGTSG